MGGPYTTGQRWRLRCHWHLRLLECPWTISWQCTVLFRILPSFSPFAAQTLKCSLDFLDSINFSIFLVVVLQYNFEGRFDLLRFIKTIQKVGLYAHLRIGPYVCAEWNFGYFLLQLSFCWFCFEFLWAWMPMLIPHSLTEVFLFGWSMSPALASERTMGLSRLNCNFFYLFKLS